MKTLIRLTLCAFTATLSLAINAGERVGDFALIDHQGTFQHMAWYNDHTAVVILVQANGAEETINSLAQYKALRAQYEDQGIEFLMLNPGLQTDRKSVQAEAAALDIDFPILMDDAQLVAETLGITRLGEVVIYDPNRFEVVYRGSVNDQLGAALQKILAGEEVQLTAVTSGTKIEFPALNAHAALSYEKDIAPIIAENCAGCHREGGIAPFAMDGHMAVQGWSPMIKEVVMTGRMPPGQVDTKVGLKVGSATNLSNDEIQKLVHWINTGSKVDSDVDPLAALTWPDTKWVLGEPDMIVKVPPQTIPATGVVDYMDIPIELNLTKDRWIRGSIVVPGEPSILHHIITTVIPPDDGTQANPQELFMALINSLEPEFAEPIKEKLFAATFGGEDLNFTDIIALLPEGIDLGALFGGNGGDAASIAGYAPGSSQELNEPGVGGLLKAGSNLNLQMHYTTTGKELTDATEIGIYFYPEGEVPTVRVAGGVGNNFSIQIPAGAKDYEMQTTTTVKEDVYLETLMPHMHFRGKRMKFIAKYPDGSEELILSVPNYSFNWQLSHRLDEPLLIPAGTKIVAIGAYDNSEQNTFNPDPYSEVKWGEQSWEEMFMGFYSWKIADQGGSE